MLLRALVYTEAPLGDSTGDLDVRSRPLLEAPAGFTKQIGSAQECNRKAQEWQARNCDKRRSAVAFEQSSLVLVDSHALLGFQEGVQPGIFAMRWLGSSAARSCVSALACIIILPVVWRCYYAIDSPFLSNLRNPLVFHELFRLHGLCNIRPIALQRDSSCWRPEQNPTEAEPGGHLGLCGLENARRNRLLRTSCAHLSHRSSSHLP